MRRGVFICLTGIDGAGKTTLARFLLNTMKEEGVKCKYAYCRLDSALLRFGTTVIKKFLASRGKDMEDSEERAATRKEFLQNPFISLPYLCLVLCDYPFQVFRRVSLPLLRGQSIACDRYVYDTMVDLATDLGYSRKKVQILFSSFFWLMPKPDVVFLIDLPEQIAYQRNLPKGDGFSVDYLSLRRKLYLDMSKQFEMMILDGSQELAKLESLVQGKVKEVMK